MGNKKKRNHPDLEELLARPWCYYCERDFPDIRVLMEHQRAKHFKCERCGRRLNTAGGLSVHMNQVHKETLSSIDNALPNRSGLEVEIFGTEGIPQDVVEAHRQRVLTQFAQAEAERRAATGNPSPGQAKSTDNSAKKVKIESKEDIKKRMAEFKAKKAAATQHAGTSGSSPATPSSTDAFSGLSLQQSSNTMTPQNPYGNYAQPYSGPAPGLQQAPTSFSPPQSHSGFSAPQPPPFGNQGFPSQQPYPGAGPPGFSPQGQYPVGASQGGFPGGPPAPYGAGPPTLPYGQQGQSQPPRMNTPTQGAISFTGSQVHVAPMSPSNLPQRPAFATPPVSAVTMQQMHQGFSPQQTAHTPQANGSADNSKAATPLQQTSAADPDIPAQATIAPNPEAEAAPSKKSKKDDKAVRMIYSDNEVSPEEKMALLPQYAFHRGDEVSSETRQLDIEEAAGVTNPAIDD